MKSLGVDLAQVLVSQQEQPSNVIKLSGDNDAARKAAAQGGKASWARCSSTCRGNTHPSVCCERWEGRGLRGVSHLRCSLRWWR